jgi:hypothetical protein
MVRLALDAQRTHITEAPHSNIPTEPRFGGIGPPLALKEMIMTPKFLREEAARFRGMAGTAELEASKLRLLAMAIDFESRATAADGSIEPKLNEGIKVKAGKKIAKESEESD